VPWSLYLALKYLFPHGKRLPFFTTVSICGVALGVMLLLVVQSVMGGFGAEIRSKMIDTSGHIQVRSGGIQRDPEEVLRVVREHPSIAAASPYAEGMVMLQFALKPTFPVIRGFDPETVAGVVPLERFLLAGSLTDLDDDSVLLSSGLASSLGVLLGDEVEVYTPLLLEKLKQDAVLLPRTLRVAGVFETGWNQVDDNTVVCTLRLMQDLYNLGSGIHGVSARLKASVPPDEAVAVAAELQKSLPATVQALSWLEMNRDFLFVLALEKNMLFFLLLFVVLVSAFAIASNMLITVVRKTREIGVLAAMGGSPRGVALCFCWQGLLIGICGTILGLALGVLALHYRNGIVDLVTWITGNRQALARFYQFAELPVSYVAADFVRIGVASIVLATLAGLLPAWRAARLKPADALRAE
jgi:lipoprotein-releasing system permease protein